MKKWILIGWAIATAVCVSFAFIMALLEAPNKNEVQMPCAAYTLKGDNYTEVIRELEDMGFYNIEASAKKDLITGWITKDGSVDKVSINGNTDFEEGAVFPKDAKIVITYHTFKD